MRYGTPNPGVNRAVRRTRASSAARSQTTTKHQTDSCHRRYIRAFEVGRDPTSTKYEVHVKLRTLKNGPVVRNRLRLPHPVKTDLRICVIAPRDSKAGKAAVAAGAAVVGEDEVFEAVKEGRIDFDRCLCHADSLQKMNKAGLGRILGPKGLMPSAKTGTVVKEVGTAVKEMVGGAEYRERLGVVRMAIGQLGFSPEELQKNIRFFMSSVKKDIAQLSDRISKDVHEVVSLGTCVDVGWMLVANLCFPGAELD